MQKSGSVPFQVSRTMLISYLKKDKNKKIHLCICLPGPKYSNLKQLNCEFCLLSY